MGRPKKSNFAGSPYQKKTERIAILENAIDQAIKELNKIQAIEQANEAKNILITAWIRESNI